MPRKRRRKCPACTGRKGQVVHHLPIQLTDLLQISMRFDDFSLEYILLAVSLPYLGFAQVYCLLFVYLYIFYLFSRIRSSIYIPTLSRYKCGYMSSHLLYASLHAYDLFEVIRDYSYRGLC